LAADFAATDVNIGQGFMRRRLPEWTGQAAQAANLALDAASTSVAGSGRTGQTGGGSADRYGESFTNTKNQIPEPPSRTFGAALAGPDAAGYAAKGAKVIGPVGGAIGFGAGAAVDWVKEQMAYRQADQRANDVLKAHEGNTRDALTAFQTAIGDDPQQPGTTPPPGPGNSIDPGRQVTPPGRGKPAIPDSRGSTPTPHPGSQQHPGGTDPSNTDPSSTHPDNTDPGAKQPGTRPSGPALPQRTAPSSWTLPPLPPAASPQPNDLVRLPNDTLVPRANLPAHGYPQYTPLPPGPLAPRTPVAPRTPGYPRGPVSQSENLGGAAAAAAAKAETGGGLPMGGMGAGAGKGEQERLHRNNTFIPDDSPFRFTDEELGVVPAVIGPDTLDYFR
jgi:hypothetical protein